MLTTTDTDERVRIRRLSDVEVPFESESRALQHTRHRVRQTNVPISLDWWGDATVERRSDEYAPASGLAWTERGSPVVNLIPDAISRSPYTIERILDHELGHLAEYIFAGAGVPVLTAPSTKALVFLDSRRGRCTEFGAMMTKERPGDGWWRDIGALLAEVAPDPGAAIKALGRTRCKEAGCTCHTIEGEEQRGWFHKQVQIANGYQRATCNPARAGLSICKFKAPDGADCLTCALTKTAGREAFAIARGGPVLMRDGA
ncbi:MAG: hypothetical protein AB7R89_23040 [Dehalococcoidia bacterium]